MLEEEKDEQWMKSVAMEFNAPITAFLNKINDPNPKFHLRWFTTVAEVYPCGHGALAASHFLFTSGGVKTDLIEFHTKAGPVFAKRKDGPSDDKSESFLIELDFPRIPLIDCSQSDIHVPRTLNGASVINTMKTFHGYAIMELSSGKAVVDLKPEFDEIKNLTAEGLIITGRAEHGSEYDFLTRFFCPKWGVSEDFVCGMANCALAPYWSDKLGKHDLIAYMASSRGGRLELHSGETTDRVQIRGKAITVMSGYLFV